MRRSIFGLAFAALLFVAGTAQAQGTTTPKAGEAAKAEAPADAKGAEAKKDGAQTGDAAKGDAAKTEETKTETPAGPGMPTETKPATETKAAPAASATGVDGATHAVRLRELEQRVDELKEQIRRSHTRLSLLSETILSGGVGGARAEIVFTNDLSNIFHLTRALFVLDGAVQYNKQDDSGALASQKRIPIFSGSIPPGDHTLQVLLQLRGHGYGVFSYLRGYRFELKSGHSFTVTEGKTIELEAIAWEKGGVTTPVEQRPAIRYVEKIRSGNAPSSGGDASDSKSGLSGSFSVGTGGK